MADPQPHLTTLNFIRASGFIELDQQFNRELDDYLNLNTAHGGAQALRDGKPIETVVQDVLDETWWFTRSGFEPENPEAPAAEEFLAWLFGIDTEHDYMPLLAYRYRAEVAHRLNVAVSQPLVDESLTAELHTEADPT
jgi:hypothetical protein